MRYLVFICLAFIACSKPLVKQTEQNYTESRKEAFTAVSAENTRTETTEQKSAFAIEHENYSFNENIEADSLKRFDENGNVKEIIYGVKGSKKGNREKGKIGGEQGNKTEDINKENLQKLEADKKTEIKAKAKTNEKNEKSFFAKIENILKLLIALTVIIYILWRNRK